MWNQLSDVAPKAVVAAAVLWAGVHYLVVGLEVGSRVAKADYLPVCEAKLRAWAVKTGKAKEEALPRPRFTKTQEMAAKQLRAFQNNPLMREFNSSQLGQMLGLDSQYSMAAQQFEDRKKQALDAYNGALDAIKRETASNLGRAGTGCSCVADTAIADTRTDWAIFSGTLGLIRPVPVAQFSTRMQQVYENGACRAVNGGA